MTTFSWAVRPVHMSCTPRSAELHAPFIWAVRPVQLSCTLRSAELYAPFSWAVPKFHGRRTHHLHRKTLVPSLRARGCEITPLVLSGGGHQSSKCRFMTARVILRAVAFCEINSNRLKARKQAGSHLWTKRRYMTARVILRAVASCEMTFYRLKAEIWY